MVYDLFPLVSAHLVHGRGPRLSSPNMTRLEMHIVTNATTSIMYNLQRTKSEFPNMIFKTISADHTACKPSNLLVKEQCLPIDQGEQKGDMKEGISYVWCAHTQHPCK
jgi:hypothetical protein